MKESAGITKHILPLLKATKADANWEVLEQYYIAGGVGVELTPLQMRIKERWEFIDEKLRQNKFRRYEIWNMVKVRFDVSIDTARRDMVGAEKVLSSSAPLNKRYKIQNRIEFLERQINLAASTNNFDMVERLEGRLQKYIEIYPDAPETRSPKKIVMNITNNILADETIETVDAELIINEELQNGDYDNETE